MRKRQLMMSHCVRFPFLFGENFYNISAFFGSQSDHDNAVDSLNKMLNEVESSLSDAEERKAVYDENECVDLESVMKQTEKQKVSHRRVVCN